MHLLAQGVKNIDTGFLCAKVCVLSNQRFMSEVQKNEGVLSYLFERFDGLVPVDLRLPVAIASWLALSGGFCALIYGLKTDENPEATTTAEQVDAVLNAPQE